MVPVPLVVVAVGAIVIEPVVAVTVTVFAPFAVRLADWVTVLTPVKLRFPPVETTGPPIVKSLALTAMLPDTVDAFIVRALASVSETLLPLVMPTVLKLFAPLVKVMSLAPAARVVIPAIVSAPVCEIVPPAVALRFPLAVRLGNVMGALSNVNVRLRRFVTPAKAGIVAPALRLRNPMSRMLVWVPPKPTAPPKLLACVSRRMSEAATVVANVVAPPIVKAPDWVIEPPAVALRLPLAVRLVSVDRCIIERQSQVAQIREARENRNGGSGIHIA